MQLRDLVLVIALVMAALAGADAQVVNENVTSCPAGQYLSLGKCLICPPGSASAPGSVSIKDCRCLPGYAGSEGACVACSPGLFKATTRSGACSASPPNSYAPARADITPASVAGS